MAIQTRRGSYNDFDPEKLLPGEWGTVQSDDPNSTDGQSVYMCFSPGQTKRMATYDDMVQNIDNAVEDVKNQFTAGMQAATEAANTAAESANQSASEATEAADRANTISDTIQSAVEGTLINDMSASSLTVYSSRKIESDFRKKSDTIDILHGGTDATTAEQARKNLGAFPLKENKISVFNDGNGVAFGKEADTENLFCCEWDAEFSGTTKIKGQKPYYEAGDTIDVYINTAGYITSSSLILFFSVPLDKPIVGDPIVTASSDAGIKLRQNGKYAYDSVGNQYIFPDSYDAVYRPGYIVVQANFSNTTNVTNNDTTGVQWSGRITLS